MALRIRKALEEKKKNLEKVFTSHRSDNGIVTKLN
jgi:hypothetical protein